MASRRGYTASDVARRILDMNGLHDVRIERVRGNLTDHYDPRHRVLRLSDTVHNSTSIAALGWRPTRPVMRCSIPPGICRS